MSKTNVTTNFFIPHLFSISSNCRFEIIPHMSPEKTKKKQPYQIYYIQQCVERAKMKSIMELDAIRKDAKEIKHCLSSLCSLQKKTLNNKFKMINMS
jgi:hypothetical protein